MALHESLCETPSMANIVVETLTYVYAATIIGTLWPLVEQGALAIPRGGYLLRRGRGRIIVEAARR